MSRLGLNQTNDGTVRKRKPSTNLPKRDSDVWMTVTIVKEHPTVPGLKCINCSKAFCGGANRIKEHILNTCPCETDAFCELKQKLLTSEVASKETKKQRVAEMEVNDAASEEKVIVKKEGGGTGGGKQSSIQAALTTQKAEDVDAAIAEMFYACNIPPAVVDHPQFKRMVMKIKAAPPTYKPPPRQRLTDDLLDTTTNKLKTEQEPLRANIMRDSGTVVSDGWDDVQKNHLINFLCGNSAGMFFDGTLQLTSDDSEDATKVAKLICDEIKLVGKLDIIQVVTDTCSVMKAAWKIIEKEFPWITCTCCGPHVLSLELHDMAKIKEPAAVMAKVERVINRFWGRKRWARMKLREVAKKNHKKDLGLYRAKATRFAGKVRQMGRMLKLKADLQEIVVSAEYKKQKWTKTKKEREAEAAERARNGDAAEDDEDEAEEEDGVDAISKIILDEDGFWKPLVETLKRRPVLRNPRTDGVPSSRRTERALPCCMLPRCSRRSPCCCG